MDKKDLPHVNFGRNSLTCEKMSAKGEITDEMVEVPLKRGDLEGLEGLKEENMSDVAKEMLKRVCIGKQRQFMHRGVKLRTVKDCGWDEC